jgi:hypothetical protein
MLMRVWQFEGRLAPNGGISMPDEDPRADAALQRQSLVQALIWWVIMALLIAIGTVSVSFLAALFAVPPS